MFGGKKALLVTAALLVALALGAAQAATAHQPVTAEPSAEQGELVDPADSQNVELVGQVGGAPYAVALQGIYAYIGVGPRLVVLNVSNPSAPAVVGQSAVLPGMVKGIAVVGQNAYLAGGRAGLRVVSIVNPASPTEVGFYDTPGEAGAIAVSGAYAYVADGSGGLRVVSIANPASPSEVGFYDTPGFASGVAVNGAYAYVADGSAGLRVMSIANPASPSEVGFYDMPGYADGVVVSAGYAYVADEEAGLRVINVANPANPVEVGFYDTPGSAYGVVTSLAYAFVADGAGGLSILDYLGDNPTPTSTPTATRTPSATPTSTPSATPSPTPIPVDAFEPDDTCSQARPIAVDGTVQAHTFHGQADTDWVRFQAVAGTTYLIQVDTPDSSPADVALELHDQCSGLPLVSQDYDFAPGIRVEFTAPVTGPYFLRLLNHDAVVYGSQVVYQLSVRGLSAEPRPGALILVAGKRNENDPLQSNIHRVTNDVRELFLNYGYDDSRIYYLSTNLSLLGADALVTRERLGMAITQWARAWVSADRSLTIYLVDHGDYDQLYLDRLRGEWVTPQDLDGWLDQLQGAVPGLKVNVVVEACKSGSFIDLVHSVSEPGRVVVTSTSANASAFALPQAGAAFSDHFLDALAQEASLYSSFQTARAAAASLNPYQTRTRPHGWTTTATAALTNPRMGRRLPVAALPSLAPWGAKNGRPSSPTPRLRLRLSMGRV